MKIKSVIFFWLCGLLLTNNLQSQNYFKAYLSGVKNQGYHYKTTVDSLLVLCEKSQNYTDLSNIASDFSTKIYNSHLTEAVIYGRLALEKIPTSNITDSQYAVLRFRLGFFYSLLKDYGKSNEQYFAIIKEGTNPQRIGQSYCQLGEYYNTQGDYFQAENFYKKGLALLEEQKNYSSLLNQYYNLSTVYNNINSKASNINRKKVLDKALSLESKITISPYKLSDIYGGYASYYKEENSFNFKLAKDYYLRNLSIAKKLNDSSLQSDIYINIGDLYNLVKKDSAAYYIRKSVELTKDSLSKAIAQHQLSTFYRLQKKPDKALQHIQEALSIASGIKNTINFIPSYEVLQDLNNKTYIFTAFGEKAKVLYELFKEEKDTTLLGVALENILTADKLIDIIQSESNEDRSKLLWRSKASSLYANGVALCMATQNTDLAFYFIEKNKALLLTLGISSKIKNEKLPIKLRERQLNLKKNILALDNKKPKKDHSENQEQQEMLFELKIKYQKLQDSISITFPSHSELVLQNQLTTIHEIQKSLSGSSAILSYIWGKQEGGSESIFGIYIDATNSEIFEILSPKLLKNHISQYRKSISKPLEIKNEQERYARSAQALFNLLFPTQSIQIAIKGKELLIIPDGELQYIPFESFLTSDDTSQYLIKTNKIDYSYSLSFSKQNEAIQRIHDNDFIGFAPVAFTYDNLSTLNKSKTEIHTIEKIIDGYSFLDTTATKDNFLKESSSRIVHLATHSDASSNPWIAFYDNKLQVHELYSYKNNAELVVLSACNTTIGDIVPGEGVMSLARGFFYAGANTVVSSLWETNDKATSDIMISFYTHLKEGKSKSEALHYAKLDYISSSNLSQKSPYYWAPFILIGDAKTKLYPSFTKNSIVLGIVLFCIIFFFLLLKKKKKKRG